MLIGLLSDTHGRHLAVRQVMALFDRLRVEHVIHCGDVGGEPVFDELVGRPCTFVWGNMDEQDAGLSAYLQTVGPSPPTAVPTQVTLDGKRFAVFHGHERGFRTATKTLDVDYIVHGHTHTPRDEMHNGIRVINPGAVTRAARCTVATLDTATGKVTFYEISVT